MSKLKDPIISSISFGSSILKDVNEKEDWINPKIEICKGGISKNENFCHGLHAIEKIFKDEPVIVFGNKSYVSKEEINKFLIPEFYIIQWDENLFSYEKPQEDIGWFINHSCEPNSWIRSDDYFHIIALRDINEGEEVVIDYATFSTEITILSDFECYCSSKSCRLHVSKFDWQIKDLQKKYENHFTPFLNKKIKGIL